MNDGDTDGSLQGTRTPKGPVSHPVPCSNCGAPTDPLRAPRVAIHLDRFRYFCSQECHLAFDPETRLTPTQKARQRLRERLAVGAAPLASPVEDGTFGVRHHTAEALDQVAGDGFAELAVARTAVDGRLPTPTEGAPPVPDRTQAGTSESEGNAETPTEVGTLLLGLAVLGGGLSVALLLAGQSSVALTARGILVLVATGALVAEYVMRPRDPTEPHPAALLAGPVLAMGIALASRLLGHPGAADATTLGAVVVAVVAAIQWMVQRARRPVDGEREEIEHALNQRAHRVVADEAVEVVATDLRPGEEIVVQPGETVPADVTVVAGTAVVSPWLGARGEATRGEGDAVVAGARVDSGSLRAVVGWAGFDRAWMRLTNDPRRRADLLAPAARAGYVLAERIAPLAAGLAALVAFAGNQPPLVLAMIAVAAQTAVANAAVAQMGALHVARTVLIALRRGIAFRTAEHLHRAGHVSSAAFCARGTLLLGEPEVTNVEAVGAQDPRKVLALVAGAQCGTNDPVATAILRAARDRDIRPDAVRSPNVQAGLGMTAIASSGQSLAVGSRALMLKERVSVASAEKKITDLEAMGRTVLLAALNGRLIGVLGLQDGLRPGARAAVQYLLDVGVEPVLLSGDARETCEALGRALDIDHIRPELLPADRGEEVRRLTDGGAVVAVVGHSPGDDAALAAADLSIAQNCAGSSSAEWGVQMASDDVRDAAYAVRLAHRVRSEARVGLGLALGPGVAAALAVAFTLLPPLVAPLAAVTGAALALARLRSAEE